jgi:hypothetical protein
MDNTADLVMTGETTNNYFGTSVAGAGDVNGDGYTDFVVGARGYDSSTGRSYLYLGGGSDFSPLFTFADKSDTACGSLDSITTQWNGQSSVPGATEGMNLEVYNFSSSTWASIDTDSAFTGDTDFDLTGNLTTSLSNYCDGSNWSYWRVYQDSGANNTMRTDLWDITFSAPGMTSSSATCYSFQRKTTYDAGDDTYWRFYYNGSAIGIGYNSSPWDTSWTSHTALSEDTYDFSIWEDDTNIYIAYYDSYDIRVRKGTLGDTAITWDTTTSGVCSSGECTVLNGSGASDTYQYSYISRDSSGYLWALAQYHDGTNYYMRAVRSSSADDLTAWDSAHDVSSTTSTEANTYGVILPLASQDMYSIWARGSEIEGRQWDNDAGGDQWDPDKASSPDSIASDGGGSLTANLSAAADTSYNVHLTYIDSSNRVKYLRCAAVCSGTFGSGATLDTGATNQYVTLSVDTGEDDVYAIFLRSSTAYYNQYDLSSTTWGGETDTGWTEGDSPKCLTSNYGDSGMIFAEWTSGTSSPYTLNWDYIIIPEKLMMFIFLGLVAPGFLRHGKGKKGKKRSKGELWATL